jgi:hypothetical protein
MSANGETKKIVTMLLCLTIVWTGWDTSVFADCELAKLLASDGNANDLFGNSVAIFGDTIVAGEPLDDDNGEKSGSAYIFHFDGTTWAEEAKLLASDGEAYDLFGYSVDIWGDTVVIGVYQDDDNGDGSGSAYVFQFDGSTWVQRAKLLASDGAENDRFGWSVAIYDDTVVIGAYQDDDNGDGSGSIYIFAPNEVDANDWDQLFKLLASDGADYDAFGNSVDIYDDTVVIGAYWDDDKGKESGSAYIFKFNGSNWTQEAKLIASSDGDTSDFFGDSVGISGDTVAIGAYGYDDHGQNSGAAYIFRFDGSIWVKEARLLASDGAAYDYFGSSVSILDDIVVIGAVGGNNPYDSGSAYVFHFDGSTWVQQAKLLASDGEDHDQLGNSVGIFGNTAVIGAPDDNDNGNYSGSAYIFGISHTPGDLDFDEDVDFYDFALFASHWLETDCGLCSCERADFTGNGQVNNYDLKELCGNWLR